MIKLIFLAIALAIVFGVITYRDDKVVIDTDKGKTLVDKSQKFIEENVVVK